MEVDDGWEWGEAQRICLRLAYRYAKNGELPVKHLGGRVYIITAEIRPLLIGTERDAA